MTALWRGGPVLVGLWAWACLAMAGASSILGLGAACVGGVASVCAARAFGATAIVECAALAGVVAVSPVHRFGFVIAGVVLGAFARAAVRVGRRFDAG